MLLITVKRLIYAEPKGIYKFKTHIIFYFIEKESNHFIIVWLHEKFKGDLVDIELALSNFALGSIELKLS